MNVLSIDMESWVHKYFLDCGTSKKKQLDDGNICDATLLTLDILKKHNIKTSFFVVSEIFDWYPWLIHRIKAEGHEIGFQTHTHRRLLRKKDLLAELKLGSKFIDEFDSQGFRAPQIFMKNEYLPILRDRGFCYDSSIYSESDIFSPVDGLFEVPISTCSPLGSNVDNRFPQDFHCSLKKKKIPFGSGYFIGLMGSQVRYFIKRLNRKNKPANLFVHTWQIKSEPRTTRFFWKESSMSQCLKMLPYCINRRDSVDYLYNNFKFVSMMKLINTYR